MCILAEQDKLLDQTSVSHLFPITKYLGLLATGMTGLHSFMGFKEYMANDDFNLFFDKLSVNKDTLYIYLLFSLEAKENILIYLPFCDNAYL